MHSGLFHYIAVSADSTLPESGGRALLARLIQGVIGAHRGRLELYVEDTFLAFYNTASGGRADFATVFYLWTALGLPLTL